MRAGSNTTLELECARRIRLAYVAWPCAKVWQHGLGGGRRQFELHLGESHQRAYLLAKRQLDDRRVLRETLVHSDTERACGRVVLDQVITH